VTGRQLLMGACLLLACARDAALDRQFDAIGQDLIDADTNGALRCAPRQLAVARSQLEFAQLEREQGEHSRAQRHLHIAEEHVQAANLLSFPGRCADQTGRGPND
jgi:OmpA-OmpF porin, OOP family